MDTDEFRQKLIQFDPADFEGEEYPEFYGLELLLEKIWESGVTNDLIKEMFSVFERYPDEDNVYFWSMMHGIEGIPDYENETLESINRKPSLMSLLMINRIINGGNSVINDVNLMELLSAVAKDESQPGEIIEQASDFLDYQKSKD